MAQLPNTLTDRSCRICYRDLDPLAIGATSRKIWKMRAPAALLRYQHNDEVIRHVFYWPQ